ncbi:MAG TPA: hypothetical protein HA304_02635 [Methanosarcinales archaeon]|nr:hypothetical protein [Methanosarcinales archaeon]
MMVVVGSPGKAVYAFTAIEGNLLTFEEVSQLDPGRKVTATKRHSRKSSTIIRSLDELLMFPYCKTSVN